MVLCLEVSHPCSVAMASGAYESEANNGKLESTEVLNNSCIDYYNLRFSYDRNKRLVGDKHFYSVPILRTCVDKALLS